MIDKTHLFASARKNLVWRLLGGFRGKTFSVCPCARVYRWTPNKGTYLNTILHADLSNSLY